MSRAPRSRSRPRALSQPGWLAADENAARGSLGAGTSGTITQGGDQHAGLEPIIKRTGACRGRQQQVEHNHDRGPWSRP